MRKKFKHPVHAHFLLEREEKRKAEQILAQTPFTLSDYLQHCVRNLINGEVEIVVSHKRRADPETGIESL